MSIDFTKPVQTRGGRGVRILCTDGPWQCFPVIGFADGDIHPRMWTVSGYCNSGNDRICDNDLVNVPPPKKKVQVEVRLYSIGGDLRAWARADVDGDRWHPSLDSRPFVASTTVEMEYQP
jgi:hypothetical protein